MRTVSCALALQSELYMKAGSILVPAATMARAWPAAAGQGRVCFLLETCSLHGGPDGRLCRLHSDNSKLMEVQCTPRRVEWTPLKFELGRQGGSDGIIRSRASESMPKWNQQSQTNMQVNTCTRIALTIAHAPSPLDSTHAPAQLTHAPNHYQPFSVVCHWVGHLHVLRCASIGHLIHTIVQSSS